LIKAVDSAHSGVSKDTKITVMSLEEGSGSGSGSSLPLAVLLVAGISTFIAVIVSAMSIYLHLKNYLKPSLQRCVPCHQPYA
jgi:hypothetical protein